MKPRVRWQGVPAEHRQVFAPYVARYLPSLPCWVERVTVEYNTVPQEPGETVYLATSALEEYRTVTLHYQPAWLEQDEDARDDTVAHEFAHIAWLPVCNLVESVLSATNAPKALLEQYEARVEAATQDLARVYRAAYGASGS